MILDMRYERGVSDEIEIPTLMAWSAEQDHTQDTEELQPMARVVEDRSRGTYIRKLRDLQRVLDHQVETQQPVKVGVGLVADGLVADMWFTVQIHEAASIEEHEEQLVGHIREHVANYSDWANAILGREAHEYHMVAKAVNDRIEVWYVPQEWAGEDPLPVAYKSVLKERILFRNAECIVAPPFGPTEGVEKAKVIFSAAVTGERQHNPENPGSYITMMREDEEGLVAVPGSLERWERPKREQEQFNRRIFEISQEVDPLNAKLGRFLAQYSKEERLAITVGLAPTDVGSLKAWAMVLHQGGRRMTHTAREAVETRERAAVKGLMTALQWEHPKERVADPTRWEPRMVVYPSEIEGFMAMVRTGRHRTLTIEQEKVGTEIAVMCCAWERSVEFKVLSQEEAAQEEPQVNSWMLLAQSAAMGAHSMIVEDGPELPEEKGPCAQEGGEVLQGVFAPGCKSLEESRIEKGQGERAGSPFPTSDDDEEMTYDQARHLRRFRKGRRPDPGLQ
jgi:hypothetical protein